MKTEQIHMVTGAFGYSGQYVAKRLLKNGHIVHTLTNSPQRINPFEGKIRAFPYNFNNPEKLKESLRNVAVLYNTYWVRFDHKEFSHGSAVKNSIILFNAAKEAGVKRIVHVSITNPSEASHLKYFSGKARLENALIKTGIPHSILRPAVLFGKEDILIGNIAWILRRFPFFLIFGDGSYKLQPIYVDDFAELLVKHGEEKENLIINAIGPETFTYKGLVEKISKIIGIKKPIISISPQFAYIAGKLINMAKNDVFITKAEVEGLMSGLLYVDSPPAGETKLTNWVKENATSLGQYYKSELGRRNDRFTNYSETF